MYRKRIEDIFEKWSGEKRPKETAEVHMLRDYFRLCDFICCEVNGWLARKKVPKIGLYNAIVKAYWNDEKLVDEKRFYEVLNDVYTSKLHNDKKIVMDNAVNEIIDNPKYTGWP